MRTSCVLSAILLLSPTTWAGPVANKSNCSARELRGLDCRLISGQYNLRLLEKTIAWSDGTWHTVDPLPLVGEGLEWEKVRFEIMGQRPILQLWLWDKGVGEAGVQSLHWYVCDVEKRKLTVLAEGIVRKRHLKVPPPAPEPAPGAPPPKAGKTAATAVLAPKGPPPRQFMYDTMEPHALSLLKNGKLQWTLGGTSHGI